MTTATPQQTTRIVAVAVRGKEAADGEFVKVGFQIPAFQSQHPITVMVPEAEAHGLQVGNDYVVRLERENLKKDKNGNLHTGSKPWQYWWGWGGMGGEGEKETPADHRQQDTPPRRDATGISIEHQQSLIQANLAYWEYVKLVPDKKPISFVHAAHLITRAAVMFQTYLESGKATPYVEDKD